MIGLLIDAVQSGVGLQSGVHKSVHRITAPSLF